MMQQPPNPMLGTAAPGGIASIAQPQQQAPAQQAPQPTSGQQDLNKPLAEMLAKFQQAQMEAAAINDTHIRTPMLPPISQQVDRVDAARQQAKAAMAPSSQMAAAGGVDQLKSNLQMAGGGIVGFATGPDSAGASANGTVDGGQAPLEDGDIGGAIQRLLSLIGSGMTSWRDKEQAKAQLQDLAQRRDIAAKQGKTVQEDRPKTEWDDSTGASGQIGMSRNEWDDSTGQTGAIGGGLKNSVPPGPPPAVLAAIKAAATKTTRGAPNQGIAAAAPAAPEAQSAIRAATEKSAIDAMGMKPNDIRDQDAAFADNKGLPAVLARRAAQEKELRDAQAGIAAASKPNFWNNMLAQPDTFTRDSAGVNLLRRMGVANSMGTAQDIKNKEDAYKKLLDVHKIGEGSDTLSLDNNKAMVNAGLAGAKGARTDKIEGAKVGAEITKADEMTAQRREAALLRSQDFHLRMAEMSSRAREVAQARGDKQSEMALSALERAAQVEGTKRAAAEAKLMGNMDMTDINSRASMYAAQMLQDNPRYKAKLAEMGIDISAPKAATDQTGWNAKIVKK